MRAVRLIALIPPLIRLIPRRRSLRFHAFRPDFSRITFTSCTSAFIYNGFPF